jgi:glutamine synthetase
MRPKAERPYLPAADSSSSDLVFLTSHFSHSSLLFFYYSFTMSSSDPEVTRENIAEILQHDTKVKVAGVDVDGILRGKLMKKDKFLSILTEGFGFCSVVFGWDQHDATYFKELAISNKENGYRDLVAVPDLRSFRRIPWENNVPFFLISFLDPDTREPVCACPRGLLKTAAAKPEAAGYRAMAGGMYNRE